MGKIDVRRARVQFDATLGSKELGASVLRCQALSNRAYKS